MALDDFIQGDTSESVSEEVEQFVSLDTVPPKMGGVYGIFTTEGECLYIGETTNLISRIDNHLYGGGFVDKLKRDPDPTVDPEKVWSQTRIKFQAIEQDSIRKQVEDVLKHDLDPEYTDR